MSSEGPAQHFDAKGFKGFLKKEAGLSSAGNLAAAKRKSRVATRTVATRKGKSFCLTWWNTFFLHAKKQHARLLTKYESLCMQRSAFERLVSARRFTPLRVQEPMPCDERPLWEILLNGPICSCGVNAPRRVFELTRTQASAYFAQSLDLLRRDLKAVATLMSEWNALAEEAAATIAVLTI
jgi:hypothetical protein